jgi:hypothetical protein
VYLGGRGWGCVELCWRPVSTLFLTRFRTCKIARPTQTNTYRRGGGLRQIYICRTSLSVLWFRDVFPGYRIRLSIRDPESEFFPSQICIKELSILPKNMFLSSRKYDPGCSSWIPDPDPGFLPIPDPGSRGKKSTGSRIRTRKTGPFTGPFFR